MFQEESLQAKLIRLIREHAMEIRSPEEPPFVLKNGTFSRFYLDCRKLTLYSEGIEPVVECMLGEFYKEKFDAVGGPCVGADPIVGGMLYRFQSFQKMPIRGFLIRKQEKDHGNTSRIIGSVRPGDRCVFIEDVTTTGQTSLEAIEILEEFGAKVIMVCSLVDREQGAAEAFAARNIPFRACCTLKEITG